MLIKNGLLLSGQAIFSFYLLGIMLSSTFSAILRHQSWTFKTIAFLIHLIFVCSELSGYKDCSFIKMQKTVHLWLAFQKICMTVEDIGECHTK